jgi:hypothetical protein
MAQIVQYAVQGLPETAIERQITDPQGSGRVKEPGPPNDGAGINTPPFPNGAMHLHSRSTNPAALTTLLRACARPAKGSGAEALTLPDW